MVGLTLTPPGGASSLLGHFGTWLPVKRSAITLIPLLEWAVPTMIEGVRP